MKSILVPVEAGDQLGAVLAGALLLAKQMDCFIEGVPVGTTFEGLATYEGPIVAEALTCFEEQPSADELGQQFTNFMAENGVRQVEKPESGLSCRWQGGDLVHENFIGNHSRLFDITAVGRPRREGGNPSITITEAVLFEGGRPIFVVPPDMKVDREFGQRILIGWNRSAESARAVTASIPLLRMAEKVFVLTVEGGPKISGPSGVQLCEFLRIYGIDAEEQSAEAVASNVGEFILETARQKNCDMLVKGAYTNSRLRQMLFGGATRHIIHHAEIPVVMAN